MPHRAVGLLGWEEAIDDPKSVILKWPVLSTGECSLLTLGNKHFINTVFMMMYLDDMVLEFMKKVVSLPWIWIPRNDYTAQADYLDIHIG